VTSHNPLVLASMRLPAHFLAVGGRARQLCWFSQCTSTRFGSLVASLAAACMVAMTPVQAAAQSDEVETRAVARRMAEEAATLFDGANYEEARDLFHRANQIYPAPTLEVWEARALDKLGRLLQAEELYTSVQRYRLRPEDPEVVHATLHESAVELEALRKRIPTITIQLVGANPSDPNVAVELDGKRLNPVVIGFPKPADTGTRIVRLLVNGRELQQVRLELKEGDRTPVELHAAGNSASPAVTHPSVATRPRTRSSAEVAAEPNAAPGNRPATPWYRLPTAGWISLGVGATGVAVGAITGALALSKHSTLTSHCAANGACAPEYGSDIDAFHAYRAASVAGFVVGGLGLAAGTSILWVFPAHNKGSAAQALRLQLTPSSAVLAGRF
jgi:hypothetical protein